MKGSRNKHKRKAARILAAAMVITMAVPSLPSAAAKTEYGDPSVIQFEPKDGPDLTCSNYSGGPGYTGGRFSVIGRAGYPLTEAAGFAGIPTMEIGSRHRPVLPEFQVDWPGYVFDGWYNEAGNKVLNLPYAFQYKTPAVYEARWRGRNDALFLFKISHYRIWNGEDRWPLENHENGNQEIRLYPDQMNHIRANTPVSATYRRDIPGYRMKKALIRNNRVRAYADPEGGGTLEEGAAFNELTMAVRGKMPNDNLTVAYLYEPDGSEFTLRVECAEKLADGREILIQAPESRGYAAEEGFTINPPHVTAYAVTGARLIQGQTPEADRGIYSTEESGCVIEEASMRFTGSMPNQNVTLRYLYERDANYTTKVTVNSVNDRNEYLGKAEMDVEHPPSTVTVEILDRREEGYLYPPNILLSPHFTNAHFNQEAGTLTFDTDITGGTVNLTYNENINDTTRWKRVSYYSSAHGRLEGDASPKAFPTGSRSIEELTAGSDLDQPRIVPVPENEHYIFDGWYIANGAGNGKVGDTLTGEINVIEDMKLYANFEEKEGEWFDLNFVSGSHGTIEGNRSLHEAKGTLWSQINLPSAAPEENYIFNGWYDEAGNQADGQMQIMSDQTYTARFTPIAGDDHILAVPDVQGQAASDGQGEIQVIGANEARKYGVTDQEGMLLSFMTGSQLRSSRFRQLPPGGIYYVYEMAGTQQLYEGVRLSEQVDESDISQPAMVRIFPLGDNYTVSGSGAGNKRKLVIRSSALDTVYAILDEEGNALAAEGELPGNLWKNPEGSPLSVEFPDLEINTGYTVVAKRTEEEAEPEEKASMGSSIFIFGPQEEEDRLYTLRMLGGGFVDEVIRDGTQMDVEEGAVQICFRAGDQVKINWEPESGEEEEFKQWEVLLGDVPFAYKTRRSQTITMDSGDVSLQAVCQPSEIATPSNASLDYTPKNGKFSLDPSNGALERLKEELIDNGTDRQMIGNGRKVEYTVKFAQQRPVASASEAVKNETGDEEGLKLPWQLNLSLTRKVDGVNKPLPEEESCAAGIRALGRLDTSILGNLDYRLWRVRCDDAGEFWCQEAVMEPDPNESGSGFTGSFSFEADIGDMLVMSYCKANRVTIRDTKRGVTAVLKVKNGHALEDAQGYMDLEIFEPYMDPVTGVMYEFCGLSRNPASSYVIDPSDPVTKTLQLYTIYEAEDHTPWQEAAAILRGEIGRANALKNNGSVSQSDRDTLSSAINAALEVLNRLPRSSVQEVEETYESLRELAEAVRNGLDTEDPEEPDHPEEPEDPNHPDHPEQPDKPEEPDHPDEPDNGGSNQGASKGGGGSGAKGPGGGSLGISGYKTYISGRDGHWIQLKEKDSWSFVLNSSQRVKDQWANILHGCNGTEETFTYHFNKEGVMDSGWLEDEERRWYYLSTCHDGAFGRMMTGWYYDEKEKNWYYLNPFTGAMLTGWRRIGEGWYYLEPSSERGKPLGALYRDGYTPDGYKVGESGAWLQESP